jgi:hypothetical protein
LGDLVLDLVLDLLFRGIFLLIFGDFFRELIFLLFTFERDFDCLGLGERDFDFLDTGVCGLVDFDLLVLFDSERFCFCCFDSSF